jgi:hypothetical protein
MKISLEKISTPPKGGAVRYFSNLTPLSRDAGKLAFVCPICGISFEKPAAWAKRCENHYCSRACCTEGRKVRIETHCVVCGKAMEQTPSDAARITTCGKHCSSIRRRSDTPRPSSFALYKKAAKNIVENGACCKCGKKHGPWIVRCLNVVLGNDNNVHVDADSARLWCKHCHLKDIAPIGGDANKLRIFTHKHNQRDNVGPRTPYQHGYTGERIQRLPEDCDRFEPEDDA